MINIDKSPIETAAQNIISISNELSRLRETIVQHSNAANGLESAAVEISNLATTLRQLPEPLMALFQRGDQFIAKADQSLAPATTLAESLESYSASFTQQQEALAQLIRFGEQHQLRLSEVDQTTSLLPTSDALHVLGEKISQLSNEILSGLKLSNERIDLLQKGIEKTYAAIVQTFKMVDAAANAAEQRAIKQDRQAQETTENLLKLERLAKRSFFAVIFGRDK